MTMLVGLGALVLMQVARVMLVLMLVLLVGEAVLALSLVLSRARLCILLLVGAKNGIAAAW
jgi:hypothetical protein